VKFGMDVQEEALRRGERPATPGWGEEPESHWGSLGDDEHRRPVPTLKGDYGAFYRSLADALVSGGPMPVNPNDAVATLDAIEAARRSAAERRVVSLR
jgi:predicted dehydrogenase